MLKPPLSRAEKSNIHNLFEKFKRGELDIAKMDSSVKQEIVNKVYARKKKKGYVFTPSAGPQMEAYHSKADILLYGGQQGGGKTGLILGLSLNEHHRSLIVRKNFNAVQGIFADCKRLVLESGGTDDGFVGGNSPLYKKNQKGSVIEFQGVDLTSELDSSKQGNPYDFIGIDEAAQLPKNKILTLLGWNRVTRDSLRKDQRVRCVMASNPPIDSTGDWLCDFFAPWLDDRHPNPAKPGELRWFYFDDNDSSIEAEDGTPFEKDGLKIYPHSRSYIPARLEDNPFIDDGYRKQQQMMPSALRKILSSGNFMLARTDPTDQLIPTDWVREAMDRWEKHPYPPLGTPLTAIGFDLAQGGSDNAVLAKLYDHWFDELITRSGRELLDGDHAGQFLFENMSGEKPFVIYDGGGGYGGGLHMFLKSHYIMSLVKAYMGIEATLMRTACKQFKFFNLRSAAYWKLREALDPNQEGGAILCLPRNRKLLTQLTCIRYELTQRGYQVTPKEEVKKILRGSSSDEGDAVVMAHYGRILFGSNMSHNKISHKEKIYANVGYSHRKRSY